MAKKKKKGIFKKCFSVLGKFIVFLFLFSILLTLLYRWVNPPITYLMIERKIAKDLPIKKKWTLIEEISPHFINCAVAAEDNNFLAHNGFDFGAIQKAIDEREQGKRKRGASTISQQTAKNVFLWPKQSWFRKGCEVYFTFLIETFWSKERIMEVYLNVIEMGPGIYGCEAASQHYFRKSASKVSAREASLITAIYPNPFKGNPSRPSNYLQKRSSNIRSLSSKIGNIKFDKESIKKAKERYQKREELRRKKNDGKVLDIF
ncbi:MAG TPA: monofunctional biosynthetic peptidoglycan transglycosylase [Bacteroidales bacterium]|jgi:monofunctional biosynthetic peptidoglycan transglycosylase|nr:monofunctional biosynthetic peptidoglycan transglycosylase [Bacteroidales bacterium]HOS58003.1 monofunctional biosynthetic peptidoglycan transglycosylase [Bacteroidales bacterium]HRR03650.1 monofunctional biosynthetic peptidoglycan transglycosylase [Bacteroidales bacterium]HRT13984.1 monofunctional biosynthetic peptidoglycan transglycosylase [Bacteroidales bacterium]HXK74163.1 monofunctional biosynthetic peptidoglycan transglycosylase [Bacteroidales bacterium]